MNNYLIGRFIIGILLINTNLTFGMNKVEGNKVKRTMNYKGSQEISEFEDVTSIEYLGTIVSYLGRDKLLVKKSLARVSKNSIVSIVGIDNRSNILGIGRVTLIHDSQYFEISIIELYSAQLILVGDSVTSIDLTSKNEHFKGSVLGLRFSNRILRDQYGLSNEYNKDLSLGNLNQDTLLNRKHQEDSLGGLSQDVSLNENKKDIFIREQTQETSSDLPSQNYSFNRVNQDSIMNRLNKESISSRYKKIVTQGINIGETAETLISNEILLTWYGLLQYGITDELTAGSLMSLNALGGPNLNFKYQLFKGDENFLATGISIWKIPGTTESALNLNIMWDSESGKNLVSHSFVTLAAISYDNSKETTAIKSFGSSAIQSGFEFIRKDWQRVLFGPNYNFESKALGGYGSFLWLWDRFHLQLTLASTNVSKFNISIEDGYYGFLDAYWRY